MPMTPKTTRSQTFAERRYEMASKLTEEVFKRGMLTRKAIDNIQSITRKWFGQNKQTLSFDFYRERIEEFAAAKRKAQRAEIVVALDTIGWNGIFRADDIAEILLNTDTRQVARERAIAKLNALEAKYNENKRKAAILRKGIEQVLPKKWQHEMSVSASGVNVRFYPPIRKDWVNVCVEGAENIYAFLQMILKVRPMLHSAHMPFTFETFQTVDKVWSMGESTYCYNYPTDTTGAMVLEKERKSYKDYFAQYELPENIKATILDRVRDSISSINYGVYYSPEDGYYNSLVRKPIPDNGVWVSAGKAA